MHGLTPIFVAMLSLDLTGKTALVAGSTQGIGLASAQSLADLSISFAAVFTKSSRRSAH